MATRGEIGLLLENGAVVSRYQHNDCYISRLGADIYWELDDSECIEATVFGCDEDRLINYYNDDCLHDLDESADFFVYPNVKAYQESIEKKDREYLYLWAKDKWWVEVAERDWDLEKYIDKAEGDRHKFYELADNGAEVYVNPDKFLEYDDKGDIKNDS